LDCDHRHHSTGNSHPKRKTAPKAQKATEAVSPEGSGGKRPQSPTTLSLSLEYEKVNSNFIGNRCIVGGDRMVDSSSNHGNHNAYHNTQKN